MKLSLDSSEFGFVLQSSKSLIVGDLLFKLTPCLTPGLGFAVSKKYGNAVQRNRFKRQCRSAFKSLILDCGKDIAMIILPKKSNISNDKIVFAFKSVAKKITI